MGSRDGRVSSGIAMFLAGALIGLFGAPSAALRSSVNGMTIPWGAIMAVVALGVCVRAAGYWMRSKVAGALMTIGWIVVTLAYTVLLPGGDVLLPDVPRTYGYLVGGFIVCLIATWWPMMKPSDEGTLVSVEDVGIGISDVG